MKRTSLILYFSTALTLSWFCNIATASTKNTDNSLYYVSIPALRTDQALTRIAKLANKSILFNYDIVRQHHSAAAQGNYLLNDLLALILKDTSLNFELNDEAIIISERPATPPVKPKKKPPAQVSQPEIEELSITGYAASIKQSLLKKQTSEFIVDSVANEDLGKYPDKNVAEALQRIPGVSIDRNGGEGQFISVRGFGPEFNTVLYNGRILATENQGREFSFDVLATELISGANVQKTPTAATLSGGIGSTVDLITTSPLDYLGLHSVYQVDHTYDSLADQSYPHYSALISYSNDTWGWIVSGNYQNRLYQIDSVTTDGWLIADLNYVDNKLGSGDFSSARIPRNIDFKRETGNRSRAGGTLIVEWNPLPELNISSDFLYSEYDVNSKISDAANWTHDFEENFKTARIDTNNTLRSYQYKDELNLAGDFAQLTRNRPTNTSSYGLNIKWEANETISLSYDISHSTAENNNGGNEQFVVVGIPNINPHYEFIENINYPSIRYDKTENLEGLKSHLIIFEGNTINDKVNQQKLDITVNDPWEFVSSAEIGIHFTDRKKKKDAYITPWGQEFSGYQFDIPNSFFTRKYENNFLDSNQEVTWFDFNAHTVNDFLWSDEQIQKNIKSTNHPLAASIDNRKEQGGTSPKFQPNNSWAISETPTEYYGQLNFKATMGSHPLSANLGVRYANTRVISSGNNQKILTIEPEKNDPTNLLLILSQPLPITIYHNYTNALPSGNIKLNYNDQHQLQLAASKSITRPSFHRLTPSIGNLKARVGASQATSGNPYLSPYIANNLDASWTYYYKDSNYFSFNAFYKKIDEFVTQVSKNESLFTGAYGNFLVTKPENTTKSSIDGYELSFLYDFSNGFGIQGNYTFLDNNKNIRNEAVNPFLLEGLSDNYNLVFFYDKNNIQTYIAYNSRAAFLRSASGFQSQPETVDDYNQIDISFYYDITKNVKIMLEITNLTQQKKYVYSVFNERLIEFSDSGSRMSTGIHFRF